MARVTCKNTCYGLVEVKQQGSDYVLYVGGSIKAISKDLSYIMSKYDEY